MSHSVPLVTSFDVRFCETDALQHVSNTALVAWFEAAREPIFRMFTPELDLQNWPLILASYKVENPTKKYEPFSTISYVIRRTFL